ncbi:hypothetical protein JCM10213_004044 [Rhodosporidiobolus nylandii]
MPHKPYCKVTVDFGYDIAVTIDFEAALLSDEPFEPITLPLPLAGKWELARGKGADGQPMLIIRHGPMAKAALGPKVAASFSLRWIEGNDKSVVLERAKWTTGPLPDDDEEGETYSSLDVNSLQGAVERVAAVHAAYDPAASRRYRLTVYLTMPSLRSSAPAIQYAERMAGSETQAEPTRVRFAFASAHTNEVELWANSDTLARSSPYFHDLLSSDFAEAQPRRSKRARKSGAQPVDVPAQEQDFDDSDDETGAFLFSKKPPSLDDTAEASDLAYREISITQTAYSTYRAFLVYLQTGFVQFAPLRSAVKPSNPSAVQTRDDFLEKYMAENESLPHPVSPKSMYRLADFHRLAEKDDKLGEICICAFSNSLTIHGAAAELFSDTSVAYEPVRKAALAFVVERFEEVSATESWKEMMAKVKRDEVQGSSSILIELMEAQREAAAAKEG